MYAVKKSRKSLGICFSTGLCILNLLASYAVMAAPVSATNSNSTGATSTLAKNSANNALNNPDVQANLQSILNQNPALAAQVSQSLAGASDNQNNTANMNQSNAMTNNANNNDAQMQANIAAQNQANNPWQSQDPTTQVLRAQSFQSVTNQAFPLTPTQIQSLNNMLDDTLRAQAAAPYDAPPMPTSTSLLVNLDPGATPPVIRLSKGFVSSLVFIDSSGAPWPIEAYDLGNPSAFNIKWDTKSNTLMVQAMAAYTYGNLAVKLQNLNTPVMLTLVPGQKQIDYRVDLRIQGLGPNAKPSIGGNGLPSQADPVLLDILDGIAPPDAKQLTINGGLADAWLLKNDLFVRTRFDLISPGWISKMSSADGTNAYKLQPTPLLLISRYGKVVSLKVEGL